MGVCKQKPLLGEDVGILWPKRASCSLIGKCSRMLSLQRTLKVSERAAS